VYKQSGQEENNFLAFTKTFKSECPISEMIDLAK
jgi:hypothetical protein